MIFLLIETTCDETAAAVVVDRGLPDPGPCVERPSSTLDLPAGDLPDRDSLPAEVGGPIDIEVLSSVVASQDDLHQRFGGIVPEIASRAHVERILPVIDETLRKANVSLTDIGAVAVAVSPGLAGSLLVGLCAAKSLALALDIPLIAVQHLEAHIYACQVASGEPVFPCVGFVVSGGHTILYRCDSPLSFTRLGGTIDDAAGEAFDKVASLLGLPYPGGPAVSRVAEQGNGQAYDFPRAMLGQHDRLEFSFSGLKTAVRYAIAKPPLEPSQVQLSPQQVADLAASFQEAVVDVLVDKAMAAVRKTKLSTLCVGGGVAANARLRSRLEEACRRRKVRLIIAPPALCTDNAVMGAIAVERYRAGLVEELSLDVVPGPLK